MLAPDPIAGLRVALGDPYVTHPLTVATILAGLGADDQTLCAAMLHDTVEDTPYTLTALSREFGPDIAVMVAGSMALDSIKWRGGRKVARVITAVGSADTRVVAMKLISRPAKGTSASRLGQDAGQRIFTCSRGPGPRVVRDRSR
jgi:GTP pyrophosphokinase